MNPLRTDIIIQEKHWLTMPLLLLLICIPYSNTITNSWHLDDIINILWNEPLHLNDLSLSGLINTFFAYPTQPGKLYRPISCLTLALNWFFGQDETIGYHLVNIFIHILTAYVLYKTILLLIISPRLKGKYQGYEQFIAVITTIFWAVNPIQTQAVTYIIQRMASLSALFYLLALYYYIIGRNAAANSHEKGFYFFLMVLSFLFALGSKENSIILPFSVLLVEIIFFSTSKITLKHFFYFCVGMAALLGFAALVFSNEIATIISYDNRNFSLLQRLLTESRIVCWYLSLVYYPSVTRLSIEHDIQLSTSLFTPITTLPSILLLLTLCLSSIWGIKKYPVSSFAILFFLLNHLVESTFIPLELIFEHRNYLPSLFLFWPIAIFFVQVFSKYKKKSVMYCFLIAFSSLLMSSLAIGTYIRNQVWKTEKSLWSDAATKAPNSMRAFLNLAYSYEYENEPHTALRLYQQALTKSSPTREKFILNAYNNIGNILRKMGRNEQALFLYSEGLKLDDKNKDILFNKFLAQQAKGRQSEAKQTMRTLIKLDPKNSYYLIAYGNIEILEGTPQKGMQTLRNALAFSSSSGPPSWQILLSLSLAANKLGQFDKALLYINLAEIRGAPDFLVGLCSLENHILSKSPRAVDHILKKILSSIPLTELRKKVIFDYDNTTDIALDKQLILESIDNWIRNQIASSKNEF